jgi:hypothetical protein
MNPPKKSFSHTAFLSISAMLILLGAGHINSAIAKPLKATYASTARSDVQRDVEGYAASICLTKLKEGVISAQDTAFLNQQGQRWGSIIAQRSSGDIEHFFKLLPVIEAAMAIMPVTLVKGDGPVDQAPQSAGLSYCAEIIDAPKVRASIDKAIAKLKPAYKK